MSSSAPTPDMTFEVRFENVMANPPDVGVATTNSPLVIMPPVAGKFTWLSSRSGVFTPSEPLAMATRYELSLQPRLLQASGQPANVRLHHVLETPAFALSAYLPQQSSTNAKSEPEVKLMFNADVRAEAAAKYIEFRDANGRSVAAEARQGTAEEAPNRWDFRDGEESRTWLQIFADHVPARRGSRSLRGSEESATNEVPNLLIVTPRKPLPVGDGWRLVVEGGIRAVDERLRLADGVEVALGNVTPFTVGEPIAQNYVGVGPSIRISFSKDIDAALTNSWADWIKVYPAPVNLRADVGGRHIILEGDFKSDLRYELVIKGGLRADEDFKLVQTEKFSVLIPPIPPRLYFPAFSLDQLSGGNRSFPLLAVNVPKVRVRAKLLDPQTAVHALRGYGSYFRPWREGRNGEEPYRAVNYELVPGRTVFNEVFNPTNDLDVASTLDLDWNRMLGGRKTGIMFVDASRTHEEYSEELPLGTQALIQLTDLGMVWKKAGAGVEVFVFSHSSGQPVAGATTRLLGDEDEPLCEAVTDASGVARLMVSDSESVDKDRPENQWPERSPSPPGRGRSIGHGLAMEATWLAVQKADDLHVLELKAHNVNTWTFHLPWSDLESENDGRRVMLFSDRNLYRPGETLHLKALARDWTDAGLSAPLGLTGLVTCVDARGQQFFQTNVSFGDRGGWTMDLPLPTNSRGEYSAKLRVDERDFTHTFLVQDFQPSAFEIALNARTVWAAAERIQIPVSARYFFGKALSRAQVKWSLEAEDSEFRPERFGDFTFTRTEIEHRYRRGGTSLALTGQGQLSATSNLIIGAELPVNPVTPQPRSASLFVEVTDLNQQTLTRRVEFLQHASDFYVGLRQASEVVKAGTEPGVEAAVVGSDGKPWPETVKARISLQRIDWQNVRVQGAGRSVRYRNEAVVTNILAEQIELTPISLPDDAREEIRGQRITGFPPLSAGQYLVGLETADGGGRKVASSVSFTVAAGGSLGWDYENDVHLTLKPAQASYQPGETAEILVQSPFSGTALVTVERDRVLRSFLSKLEGNAPSIRVPIETNDAPNVYVGVTLVRGSEDCPRTIKMPEYRMGYCPLVVEDPESRLMVSVTPGATNCVPAQLVEVTVDIKDSHGMAVQNAEVTLYAVDDGILTITDYGMPDPHSFFYASRPLGVLSSVSLPNLLTEDPEQLRYQNKGYLGGGGGNERLRKNFLACAYWNAGMVSDENGKVTAKFPTPDSLTRYRVFAVAHADTKRFGSGKSSFQVSKPLIVEPALPQFANISDHMTARAVVQNTTAQAGEVMVTLELDEKAKEGRGEKGEGRTVDPLTPALSPSAVERGNPGRAMVNEGVHGTSETTAKPQLLSNRVSVAANGSAVVEFPVEFVETGVAKWIWKARFAEPAAGEFTDAVQSTMDVGHVAPMLREILLSRVTARETNLVAFSNPQLLAGRGTITVNVANSRLNELAEAIARLLHYPYGCVEQTGSSLLPWIVSRDMPALFPLLHRETNEVDTVIRKGVARLFTMQTQSGGLGYWPGAREPMLWASAYGGFVLALAERHGVKVPEADFEKLMKYLSEQLRVVGSDPAELADLPLALYALAVAGRAEPAYCEKLYNLREKLSIENRALLALSLLEIGSPMVMTRDLLAGKAKGRHDYDDFDCPAREQAIRLMAWVKCTDSSPHVSLKTGDDPLIDSFTEDLMREARDGHWGTTQGNAWAVLALAEYCRSVESSRKTVEGRLVWRGQSVPFHLDKDVNCFSATFTLTNSPESPLWLVNESGTRLFTSVTLETRSPVAQQPRQDHGFSLQRSYERLDDENHPSPIARSASEASRSTPQAPTTLRVGDRVLVTLRLEVRDTARYVAVDDALPSILEAVNPEFRTQGARDAAAASRDGEYWMADFQEMRKDRFLSFANWVRPGTYTLRYVARVRAAGEVTAPSAKVEEMYHPDRYGISETQTIASGGWE
jgi:uncharacterized protein YfaS (alpha-2-macroglobulin family)